MIIRNIPLRHELKYFITPAELNVLRSSLKPVMQLDPNGNENNEYHIRSLYFDTINDDALEEKSRAWATEKKYRIRIYNFSDRVIKLECKSKYGDLISSSPFPSPRIGRPAHRGRPEGLQRMRHPLLHDVYREMKTRLLRPVVIVDYIREAYIHPAEEVRITFDQSRFAPACIRLPCSTRRSPPIRSSTTRWRCWKSSTTSFCRRICRRFSAA